MAWMILKYFPKIESLSRKENLSWEKMIALKDAVQYSIHRINALQGNSRFYRVAVWQAVISFHEISLAPCSRWSHGGWSVLINDQNFKKMEQEKQGKRGKGRPKKEIVRTKVIGVRVSTEERFNIRQSARLAGISMGSLLRKAGLNVAIKERLSKEQWEKVRQLIGIGANLNQIAKACNKAGIPTAALSYEETRAYINNLINQILK